MNFDPKDSSDLLRSRKAGSKRPEQVAPHELMLLFTEAASMPEARWASLIAPDGKIFRNFSRCSRPGFSPRFGSGATAAPRPAEDGLEVCREEDGWLLELVFDDKQLSYQDLSARLKSLLEIIRQG